MDVLIAHVAHQRWSGEGGSGVERHVFALAIFRLAELCRSVVGKEVNFQRRIGCGYVPYRRLFIDAADGKHAVAAVCREAAEVNLLVGKVEVKLNDCISRWNDFFKSTLYTQHAKDVITSMTHIADVTLKSFKQPNTFKVITNDTVKNIVDLIKNIDVNSEAHKFGNISNYVNQNLPRESVRQRLAIEIRVLQFLKELFLHPYAPFSEFPAFSATVDDTYYYSVCCNLIYFKDSSIKESLIYESYLYVGDYLITEGKSLVDYFNKLQDKIGDMIQKKELVNWGDYVKKAIFKGEINNKSDGENSQTISDEELEKCAADVVASTVGAAAVAKKS